MVHLWYAHLVNRPYMVRYLLILNVTITRRTMTTPFSDTKCEGNMPLKYQVTIALKVNLALIVWLIPLPLSCCVVYSMSSLA